MRWLITGLCWGLLALACSFAIRADGHQIRAAIYENKPLMFTASDGSPSGFVIDILNHIAAQEGWIIDYVPCVWADCLAQLEHGNVDLLGAIAFSEQRAARFDFSNETVIASWGRIHAAAGAEINSVLDLAGKTIAVVKNDIYTDALQKLADSFDISYETVHADDYASVLRLVDEGNAHAGVVSRLFGAAHADKYKARPTSLIFSPIEVRFAVPKGEHQELLDAIDRHLVELKADETSIYYRRLDYWFDGVTKKWGMPSWVLWSMLAIGGVSALLAFERSVLRRRISARTRDLTATAAKCMAAEADLKKTQQIAQLWRWELDVREDIVRLSDEVYAIHGLDPSSGPLSLASYLDRIHPDDRNRVADAYADSVRNKTRYDDVYRIRHQDGTIRYVHAISRTEYDRDGKPIRSIGTVQDVTALKAQEHALIESGARYTNLFMQSSDAVFSTDENGIISDANQRACVMLGYHRSELIGLPAVRLYTDPNKREEFIERLGQEGSVSDWRVNLVRKDGSPLTCQVSAVVRRDLDGRIVGADKILRDIGEQIRTEKQLWTRLNEAISVLSRVSEVRDPYTAGHQVRVCQLAVAISTSLGWSAEATERVQNAALLHDIGKLAVPAEILSKPGSLSKSELGLIRHHPTIGFDILKGTDLEETLGPIILQHHERLDGSGYPHGLTDADIVPEAKILAVADVIEAMVSHRPYRPAHSIDVALAEIEQNSGILYAPDVVAACRVLFLEHEFEFSQPDAAPDPFPKNVS